jgi:diguanylate cyclase (GGDEF)-like protein
MTTSSTAASSPGSPSGGRGERALPSNEGAEPAPTTRLVTHNDILDLIVQNASLSDILLVITAMVEREIHGSRASILLLDEDGLCVRVAAGPSLPPEYNEAIDGVAIGPQVGTCGTAAYEKRIVITPNISTDPAWAPWRSLATDAGLVACWSTPFLGLHERVLGTFAVYFGEPREPTSDELALLHDAGYLAAVAVQHDTVRQMLHDTSRTNPITGLPNRIVLDEKLAAVEATSAETSQRFAVIKASVQGMAPINEALGPTVGDALLRTIATRLTDVVGNSGVATHVWGCDFVVLMTDLTRDDEAREMAEHIGDALSDPFDVEGMSLTVNVAVGLATYGGELNGGPHSPGEPLRAATVAQTTVVANEQVGVYDPSSDPGAGVHLLAPALRRGIEGEELTLAYQPIVTLADDRVDHYEALLRWTSPQGVVPPSAFVSVAEQTGLAGDLGRYALQRGLAELARQRAAGRDLGMSVNLSVRQLSDQELPGLIADLIAEHQLPPASVTMEVTEGVLLSSTAKGWGSLDRIRDVGVRVSLDDFGTGFSQLSYLRRFRFDEIKLDRTLVHDMATDVMAYAIVVGAVTFAQTAGLAVVAEGIEERTQADRLRDLGCTHGQGYLFGAARPTASPG